MLSEDLRWSVPYRDHSDTLRERCCHGEERTRLDTVLGLGNNSSCVFVFFNIMLFQVHISSAMYSNLLHCFRRPLTKEGSPTTYREPVFIYHVHH